MFLDKTAVDGVLFMEMAHSNGRPLQNIPVRVLSPKEVAERLGVTTPTIYGWINDGRLKATRIGPKLWLIRESDVNRLFED